MQVKFSIKMQIIYVLHKCFPSLPLPFSIQNTQDSLFFCYWYWITEKLFPLLLGRIFRTFLSIFHIIFLHLKEKKANKQQSFLFSCNFALCVGRKYFEPFLYFSRINKNKKSIFMHIKATPYVMPPFFMVIKLELHEICKKKQKK